MPVVTAAPRLRALAWWVCLPAWLALACNLSSQPTPEAPPSALTATSVGERAPALSLGELARAAVQLQALTSAPGAQTVVWTGSGTLISADGLILTNAHVVDNRGGEYEQLGVAVLERTDQAPRLSYLAEIAAVDYGIDLAVVRIVSDLEGNPARVVLPFVPLGDSDRIEIGDPIRILGYPGIGGETVTFTEGAISGFSSERGIEGRAWLKTDATIAGGNSGGMGLNPLGELVAIPTTLGSGAEEGGLADCRQLVDTNRDGVVDSEDTCVPLGGFINALRPVALAGPLIEAARQGERYVQGDSPQAQQAQDSDLTPTLLSNIVFSEGVSEEDQPQGLWYALPAGASDVCAFWDYAGMSDGMTWSSYWFIDGALSEGGSTFEDVWTGGVEGNWWVCIHNETGLPDGLYEIVLEVDGEPMADDSIFVGGDHRPVELVVENGFAVELCYLFLSPSAAQNWGPDRLGTLEVIEPGDRQAFSVASGEYDLRVLDCDGELLTEAYGVELSDDLTYPIPPG
jgi:serine protease Do